MEFKKDLSSLRPILKTIIAFANTSGGTLIVGVSENKTITGKNNILQAEETIANAIADSISPTLLPGIEIATVYKKDLLLIRVSHWWAPFYLKNEGMPKGVYISRP